MDVTGPTPALSTRWAAARATAPGCSVKLRNWPPTARRCWTGVGLRPGQAAIDLGCGPRGILDLPNYTGDDLPAATLSNLRQAHTVQRVPTSVSRGSVHAAYWICSKTDP